MAEEPAVPLKVVITIVVVLLGFIISLGVYAYTNDKRELYKTMEHLEASVNENTDSVNNLNDVVSQLVDELRD